MKVFLVGITGAMGRTISNLGGDFEIVGGFSDAKDPQRNIYDDYDEVDVDFDVIIDFSNKDVVERTIDFAVEKNKPLVEATTGLESQTVNKLKEASKSIPIVYTKNYSVGINVMDTIVTELTKLLDGFDIEIIEAHHNKKKDAPSGTALMLLDAVKKVRDVREVYDRSDVHKARDSNEVGISSIRAGSIAGDHTVLFGSDGEVLEITHRAGSKNVFANGAVKAARFLIGKEPGMYDFKEIISKS